MDSADQTPALTRLTTQKATTYTFADLFSSHPLLKNSYYYLLPERLCDLLRRHGRPEWKRWIEDERAVTQLAPRNTVGFRAGAPIQDACLEAPQISPAFKKMFEESRAEWGHSVSFREYQAAQKPADSIVGYLGWLWTNPTFRDELQALDKEFGTFTDARPLPTPLPPQREPITPENILLKPESPPDGHSLAVAELCRRWRLQAINGLMTVFPVAASVPSLMPEWDAALVEDRGIVVSHPDTTPIPDRDVLRRQRRESLMQSKAEAPHLAEWFRLCGGDKRGTNQITQYSRVYRLHHYMRVLFERHPETVKRSGEFLGAVFGEYLAISERTIKRDLALVARRLGTQWQSRGI